MNKTCLFLQITHSTLTRSERATAIATSTISIITAIMAVIGNALTLYAFYKYQRLRSLANIFITSLCVTDFLTGLIVQPLFATRRLHQLHSPDALCTIRLTYIFFANLCTGASLLSVGLVTIDRCIAITLPFRYISMANTATAYILVVICSWIVWTIFTLLPYVGVLSMSAYFSAVSITFMVIILVVLVSYVLIYCVVIKQRRKIAIMPSFKFTNSAKSQQDHTDRPLETGTNLGFNANNCANHRPPTITRHLEQRELKSDETLYVASGQHINNASSNSETDNRRSRDTTRSRIVRRFRNFSKEKQRANTIVIVIATLLLCYLPQIILLEVRAVQGDSRTLILIDAWADLFVYINSTLNPLIYCLRNKDIKVAIKTIVQRSIGLG